MRGKPETGNWKLGAALALACLGLLAGADAATNLTWWPVMVNTNAPQYLNRSVTTNAHGGGRKVLVSYNGTNWAWEADAEGAGGGGLVNGATNPVFVSDGAGPLVEAPALTLFCDATYPRIYFVFGGGNSTNWFGPVFGEPTEWAGGCYPDINPGFRFLTDTNFIRGTHYAAPTVAPAGGAGKLLASTADLASNTWVDAATGVDTNGAADGYEAYYTNGAVQFRAPAAAAASYVSAGLGGDKSIASGASSNVTDWIEVCDSMNEFNPTTGVFTAISARMVSVTVRFRYDDIDAPDGTPNHDFAGAYIHYITALGITNVVAGTAQMSPVNDNPVDPMCFATVNLAVGDVLKPRASFVAADGAQIIIAGPNTQFSVTW